MSFAQRMNKLLPFVAIGTIADCQSILEPTNRLLVKAGLSLLNKPSPFIGLEKLMELTGLRDKINQSYRLNSQDLAFLLSPILNASGRLNHAKLSISTLLSQESQLAHNLATELIATNEERKDQVKRIQSELGLEAENQFRNGKSVIWIQGDWSKGIVGLLASRVSNKYNKVSVIVSIEEGQAVASLRAPEGYNIPQALATASDHLIKFGGHPCAAGFTAEINDLGEVEKLFAQAIEAQSQIISHNKTLVADIREDLPREVNEVLIKPSSILVGGGVLDNQFLDSIWLLDPFGQDFPVPQFVLHSQSYEVNWLKNDKHAKIKLDNDRQVTVFNLDDESKQKLKERKPSLWVLAKPSQNTWQGKTKTELIAEKIWF